MIWAGYNVELNVARRHKGAGRNIMSMVNVVDMVVEEIGR